MWLEMFGKNGQDISSKPEIKLQWGLIIYEPEGLENMDIQNISDIYAFRIVNPKENQNTDIHYRFQNRFASFNWRLLFHIKTPEDN